jgi:hypothetical protein
MEIEFAPFSFGVATFALAIAVAQLYWNRSQHCPEISDEELYTGTIIQALIFPQYTPTSST